MIGAIVLAAGRSERMGQQKLLLPIRGKPMILGILDEVLRTSVNFTTIVLGPDSHAVREALNATAGLSPALLSFVTNSNPEGDMLSSVRCGIRALPASCEAVLIVLGDQPGLTSSLIERLIEMFRSSKRAIVVPVHNGKRGHPLLFSAKYREEVLTQYDNLGLHALLNNHPTDIIEIETGSPNSFQDLDTPQDYDRYIRETKS